MAPGPKDGVDVSAPPWGCLLNILHGCKLAACREISDGGSSKRDGESGGGELPDEKMKPGGEVAKSKEEWMPGGEQDKIVQYEHRLNKVRIKMDTR
jgi:hypothetical protein